MMIIYHLNKIKWSKLKMNGIYSNKDFIHHILILNIGVYHVISRWSTINNNLNLLRL